MPEVTVGWEIATWIIICFNVLQYPFIAYYFTKFYKLRHDPFLAPRLPVTGIMLICCNTLAVFQSMIDALVGIEVIPCGFKCLASDLTKTVLRYPGFAIFLYKLNHGWEILLVFGTSDEEEIENKLSNINNNNTKSGLTQKFLGVARGIGGIRLLDRTSGQTQERQHVQQIQQAEQVQQVQQQVEQQEKSPKQSNLQLAEANSGSIRYNNQVSTSVGVMSDNNDDINGINGINDNEDNTDCDGLRIARKNWVIRYQNTLGDRVWMARFVIIIVFVMPSIIFTCLVLFKVFKESFVDTIYFALYGEEYLRYGMLLIYAVLMSYLVCIKISRFDDVISLKTELMFTCMEVYVWSISVLIWKMVNEFVLLPRFNKDNALIEETYGIANPVNRVFDCIVWSITASLKFFIVIWYVLYKRDKFLSMVNERLSNKVIRSRLEEKEHDVTLIQLIENKNGYRLFMRHLQSEFAIENLLFLTEVIKYKESLMNIFKSVLENTEKDIEQDKDKDKDIEKEKEKEEQPDEQREQQTQQQQQRQQRQEKELVSSSSPTGSTSKIKVLSFKSIGVSPKTSVGSTISTISTISTVSSVSVNSNATTTTQTRMSSETGFPFPKLSPKIPKSDIMKEKNIYKKIDMIMERYIIDSAHLQVNISSNNRKKLYHNGHLIKEKQKQLESSSSTTTTIETQEEELLKNKNKKEILYLCNFFDNAGKEILYLLRGSFSNFKASKAYVKFVEEYQADPEDR